MAMAAGQGSGSGLARPVETWLCNQHLAKSLHGLSAALEVPDSVRGRRPAALSSRAPQLLFKGGEGSPSFLVPALHRRVGNSPGEILARRYAGADNSDTYRCRFLHGAGWSDAGWDGSVRRNPSPALAGAVTNNALRRRGPPWR
uniref:Uncharacterized protein n=1 Tax=Setaria viridis TaxID=4556 RepID=A0A4U6WDC9_SETVI|nr:hypothetical protein SEVIR_1G211200v2 [Setaria viridis]